MSYKGYASKESYLLSKERDYERHRPHIREYQRKWYQLHRAERLIAASNRYKLNRIACNDRMVRHRRKLKTEVLTHYSNDGCICVKCGYSDIRALTIDHINGGGRRHVREITKRCGSEMYRWLKKNDYPVGYQTLCFNCQWIKRDEKHEYANYLKEREG